MKALIRHSISVGTRLAVGMVLLVALAVSAVRLALPMLSDRVAEVEAKLSDIVGQPLQVEKVHADWTIWGPRLQLGQVAIYEPRGDQVVLTVDQLSVQLDVWRSLLLWQLVPHEILMSGTALEIHRRADTTVQVIGLNLAGMGSEGDATLDIWSGLRDLAYRLEHSKIRWLDDISGADYSFDDVSLVVDLRPSDDRLKVAGFVTLPPELGESVGVMLDIEGDLLAPRGWSGRAYADVAGLQLGNLPAEARLRRLGLREGVVDVELWSNWAAGDLVDLSALVEARDLALAMADADTESESLRLVSLHTGLFARQQDGGWRVDLEDLRLSRRGLEWGPTGISIETHQLDEAERWRMGADFLRLQDLAPIVLTRSELPDRVRELIDQLAPEGDLRDLRLDVVLPTEGEPRIRAQGEFRDLGIRALEDTPGLTGLTGAFSLNEGGGELWLESAAVELDYPALFAGPLWFDSLLGRVSWIRDASGYVVRASGLDARNEDLETRTRLRLEIGEGSPFLDMQVSYGRGNVGRGYRYLPFVLPQDVSEWLKQAIVSGRVPSGALVFHGPVDDFPFRHEEGVFEARFNVEDAVLAYDPQWPKLTDLSGEVVFRNASLRGELRSGSTYGLRVEEASFEIADLDEGQLSINVSADGPLADAFRFLRESPLGSDQEELLADVQTGGTSRLGLRIDMPLDEDMVDQTRVKGHLDLRGCSLGLKSAGLSFSAIHGSVDFTEKSVSIDQITAEFRGDPVSVSASTDKSGVVTADFAGQLRTVNLVNDPGPLVSRHVSGSSYWLARLRTPGFSAPDGPTQLQLRSDLVGTEIDLPYPLGKKIDESRELRVEMTLGEDMPVLVRYGDSSAALELDEAAAGSAAIKRAEFRFRDGDARLPERGIVVRGSLKRVSLSEWQEVLASAESAPARSRGEPNDSAFLQRLTKLDVSLDELELWGHDVRKVRLDAGQDRNGWSGSVSSSMLSGTFKMPRDISTGIPLVLDLEHLTLDSPANEDEAAPPDPRDLPAMSVSSKRLVWDGREFTDLRLEATRLKDGLVIHNFQLSAPHLAIRMTGDWRIARDGQQQSTVRISLESDDLGQAFNALDVNSGLSGGQGDLVANLKWPDAITRIGWTGLQGSGKVELKKGRFEDLKPGAGRLLGLMNLQYLPRRLTLDFSDIFKEGFVFDSLDGNYTLKGADIYTNDTEIIGPAADVAITGRTNVEVQEYDQVVTVTPHVKSALPIAGFLLGGLPVGAAVLLADTVFDVGKGLDRVGRVTYTVTGSWDDPRVEILSSPDEGEASSEESLFPSE